jgi:hypothetical protein
MPCHVTSDICLAIMYSPLVSVGTYFFLNLLLRHVFATWFTWHYFVLLGSRQVTLSYLGTA